MSANTGFNWNMDSAGKTHKKKCSEMLGVTQSGARNRTFHAICRSPDTEQVRLPHSGSYEASHNSLFFT